MMVDVEKYSMKSIGRTGMVAGVVGAAGLCLSVLAWVSDSPRFYHAWLTAFVFWTSMGLGGLFFTMLHHLTGAKWSVVLRRISETLMMQLPWMFLAFIPLIFGMHDIYHWTDTEHVAHDAILTAKAGFLNQPFFVIRTVAYFAIWSFIGFTLYRLSLKQDATGDPALIPKMRKFSAIGMLLFAPTLTFASFDWLMSIDPHWYSTIFGVYYFGGTFFASLGLMTAACINLRRRGMLKDAITLEHYHDLGKLMFGFTIFWSYIAFSQYFLIWYGNIPEETVWYLERWEGSWKTVSLLLLFGHFVLPFVSLVFRATKRNVVFMAVFSFWFLVMHWLDMYWLVYPTLLPEGATFSWIELVTVLGIGGTFCWLFWSRLKKHPLVPVKDPHLQKSITFVNN